MSGFRIAPRFLIAMTLALSGCTGIPADTPTTADGLVLQPDGKFGAVYAKPGVDVSSYRSFAIDGCEVSFRDNWLRDQNTGRRSISQRVTKEDMEQIRATLSEMCVEAFRKSLLERPAYTVVDLAQADASTLVLRPAIIDLNVAAPDARTPGMTQSFTTESGEATLLMDLDDALTGETLFRVSDRRSALRSMNLQWTNSVTNRSDALKILAYWGSTLREGLDQVTRDNETQPQE